MRKYIFLLIAAGCLFQYCSNKMRAGKSNAVSGVATGNSSIGGYIPKAGESLKAPRRGEVLFLGHASKHHDANKYAPWLAISLFKTGINLSYTTNLNDLNEANLNKYDGLVIYANYDSLSPAQENALKAFVQGGKGLIPLHSATGCFKNSDWYIKTVGGQFKTHGVGTFNSAITNTTHPVSKGLTDFNTWDETYVHQRINPDMTVLMERVDGNVREPYTWVRMEGKGRVFYTAYGHNDSTWTNAGFLNLVNRGILWAIGDEVKDQIARLNRPNVEIYTPEITADFTKRHLVPKMQEALSPEQSLKLTQVPVDFEVKLFASEPDITNPIAMSWDEKGRLWVVESVDYPNTFLETDGAANDRIKICEDTDGDGKADKFTVFADKLNIPTSMVFANGGVVVAMAPYFVFLKDTNGDDKADVRENIMSGWDKNDTHFGPSNLQYGFDNKIWGVVGSGFSGTTKDGKTLNFRTGVYHVNPDGTGFEFLANTSNNTWGLGFSEENNVFISTANNTHSAYYSMPAKYMQRSLEGASSSTGGQPAILPVQKIDGHYDAHTLTPNLRQVDVVGGYTSAAGHHLYTARNFPKEYWNRIAFVCEPTVRLLHNAIIEPKGAGFVEKDNWNLMASSDEWFGPVHAEVGPDGSVWVSDWYNFIIQHNVFVERQAPSEMVLPFKEQPMGKGNAFSSPLRDINHGRVYRVVYKNAKPYKPMKLSKDDLPGLLAALQNDNMFWRMTAQRLIVESKNQAAIPELFKIIDNQNVDEIGLNSPAVHALWTLHGLGALNGSNAEALQVVAKALSHPAAGVRKAAVQVLPKTQQGLTEAQATALLNDPNLNVRMTAILAITEMPASLKMGELINATALKTENGNDEWIPYALFAAAITHEDGFKAAALKNPPPQPANPQMTLSDRISMALNQEKYALPRRGNLLFPPDVAGKEITLKGTITKGQRDLQGVVVAQGGKDGGYGIYIQDGKMNMVVKQGGKVYTATTTTPLPEKFQYEASLKTNGQMSILIDGKEAAKAKAPSFFKQALAQGVRVSQDYDNENKMGTYEGTYFLTGNMQDASLELQKPGQSGSPVASGKSNTSKESSKSAITKSPQSSESAVISLKVVQNVMQYDKKLITVKAGQKVTINFENPDFMQHNFVLIKPGTMQKVGAAADAMAQDPEGAKKNYVPRMPEVLQFTKLLTPDDEVALEFTAPLQPGDYPYICTFPGHWRIMNGILRVEK